MELTRQLKEGLGLPDHVTQEGGSHAIFERVFQAMDEDDDRSITLPEFAAYLAAHLPTAASQHQAGADDRRISLGEWQRGYPNVAGYGFRALGDAGLQRMDAVEVFQQMDSDGKGMVLLNGA